MTIATAPRFRRTDPESSAEAADSTAHLLTESHRLVERILTDSHRSLTQLEIEQTAVNQYGWQHSLSRIRSAVSELEGVATVRDGFVRRDGDKRRRQLWAIKEVEG